MAGHNDVENATYPQMGKETQRRASMKISRMMKKREGRPREQIVAIGIKMAREGQIGPRGGYQK